ncbi:MULTISPECIES: hypothetical protein [unclassified Kribbella]|uniref:hypothetical protein n=1 Tax=unclassified Kribbella TaxID=2644121 RepID=UPI003018D92E
MQEADILAARPPRVWDRYQLAQFVPVRAMSTWYMSTTRQGEQYSYGMLLQGGNLYRHSTITPPGSRARVTATKLGGGWTSFKSIATSNYTDPLGRKHSFLYGLNTNGNLYRYAANGTGYKAYGSFGGFKSFKAMAMISQQPTYDTLLMTTTAGALYTIHIPTTATAKPVVKLIRRSGWSSFESLLIEHCGNNYGSVVVGIDHNTDSGYQYAFSRANGTATAITSYGRIPVAFTSAVHASRTNAWLDGE